MEWEFIAPMIMMIVLTLTVGGVIVLRPIVSKLSEVLALYAQERHSGIEKDVGQIRDLLETMDARLQLMEDRQDFTDRLLLGGGDPKSGSTSVTSGDQEATPLDGA